MKSDLACERECSRKNQIVVIERRGLDATWLLNIYHAHRWGKDVNFVDLKHQKKNEVVISSVCETLKVDEATKEHVRRFMPKLTGLNVIGKHLSEQF
ncbi:hypothetical protein Hanom_Chr04g00365961 [Helianthus anomalus]